MNPMTQKILLAVLAVVSISVTGLILLRGAVENAQYHEPDAAAAHHDHDHHAHHGHAGVNLDPNANKLDDFGPVPSFALINQNAQPITQDALKNKASIVSFIFTRCQGPCPMISARMSHLQQRLAGTPLAPRVRLVSVSVDPDHDTPAVLKTYAADFDKNPALEWTFITGTRSDIWAFVGKGGMNLAIQDTPDDKISPILHTTKLVLIDTQGRVRGYYDALDDQSTDLMLAHLQQLLTATR